MAKRSIKKRRHRYWPSFAAMMNRVDAEFIAQAESYERWYMAQRPTWESALAHVVNRAKSGSIWDTGVACVGHDGSMGGHAWWSGEPAPDTVTFREAWRETYSSGPDAKPAGTMTVVSVDRDAGTFNRE